MDIKMGITQHLDEMSEEKKALAVAKCKNSTSFLMGFRICGIKVFDSNTFSSRVVGGGYPFAYHYLAGV
jgi:hypothetical protein